MATRRRRSLPQPHRRIQPPVKISLQGLSKKFDRTPVLQDISLEIEEGEMFFLLGPSGCGKTTLLRLLAGFYLPDEGHIYFDGQRVNELPPQDRDTALVFQNYAIWPHLTVFENVAYGLRVRDVPDNELRARVMHALAQVQMEQFSARKPAQLSGGQQQRVALARSLVVKPGLLLFDEPLSNLDAKLRVEMRGVIQKIHASSGITGLYVTHDQEEALSLADRIAVLHEGKLQQIGTPAALYEDPANPFVAEFIGDINLFRGNTPLAQAFQIPHGKIFGFRPEHVVIGQGGYEAIVARSTFLGSRVLLLLQAASGEEFRAVSSTRIEENQMVTFSVRPDHIHEFSE
jgi:iron(III) transport system ATP-binding protein